MDGQNSSHLYVASENDNSGFTPPRFEADVEADMHELRNPKSAALTTGLESANKGGNRTTD